MCVSAGCVSSGARKFTHLGGEGGQVVTGSISGIIVLLVVVRGGTIGRVGFFILWVARVSGIPPRLCFGLEELALFLVAGLPRDYLA